MAEDDAKGGGRQSPSDIESLKARLGLKAPRRAPVVTPVPPPAPEPPPAAAPAPVSVPTPVAPPPPPEAPPRRRPEPIRYAEPVYEEPPPHKTLWQRWGRLAVYALIPAVMGGVVGYVFGKGATRGKMLAKVKADAGKILEVVRGGYVQVEAVASAIDPAFGAARRERRELPPVRAVLRRQVDWAGQDALAKIDSPKELEQIYDTDYKRFTRATVRLLNAFFVDFTRLMQLVRDHVDRTKAARLLLDNEAKEGVSPRAYGVIVQGLPGVERGEVVLLRGRRTVKKGQEEVPVFDVARRRDPGTPLAVPGSAVAILDAPGLFKEAGTVLDEYNRRLREIVDVLRRLLDVQRPLIMSVEKIAEMKI